LRRNGQRFQCQIHTKSGKIREEKKRNEIQYKILVFLSCATLVVINPAVSETIFIFPTIFKVETPKLRGIIKLLFSKLSRFELMSP
jgi:hypothetical protein